MPSAWSSYEGFPEDVAAALAAKKAIDAFAARQRDGGVLMCPRCGREAMKDRLHTNALSRYADIYICDGCGAEEALRDWKGIPIPLWEWAAAKEGAGV